MTDPREHMWEHDMRYKVYCTSPKNNYKLLKCFEYEKGAEIGEVQIRVSKTSL